MATGRPFLKRLLIDYDQPDSLSSRLRRRRSELLLRLISAVAAARPAPARILDIGGTPAYWILVGPDRLRALGVRITLLNRHSLGIPDGLRDLLEATVGDGCDLAGIADGAYDLTHSNSVIEHVGGPARMAAFAAETRRTGRSYYVQTPDFWFPVEPHYMAPAVHWLPARWREELVWRGVIRIHRRPADRRDARSIVAEQQLLTARRMRRLFPDAEHRHERLLGLSKSLLALRWPSPGSRERDAFPGLSAEP